LISTDAQTPLWHCTPPASPQCSGQPGTEGHMGCPESVRVLGSCLLLVAVLLNAGGQIKTLPLNSVLLFQIYMKRL
jgi:hypothetical protein